MPRHDDLIGDVEPKDIGEELNLRTADVHLISAGVSIPWLMRAFRMGRGAVERALIGVQPIGRGKHNTPLYDLPAAASKLAKPDVDMGAYLKKIKPEELPDRLRESYWNAKLKEQRWMEKAGKLWRTERVIQLYGEVLQEIRTKLTIIPDRVDREVGLSPAQVKAVSDVIDELQDDIFKFIEKLAAGRNTGNQLMEEYGDDEEEDDLI